MLIVERPMDQVVQPGQIINLLGLVGQPYRFRRPLRNVLLIAYDTAPTPLLMTIPWLLGNDISVTLALLGTAREYGTQHIPAEIEIVHSTQDNPLDWTDQVMTLGWADQVFAVVSADDERGRFKQLMEQFSQRRRDVPKNYFFGVFQPIIPCGAGACHACTLRTRDGGKLVCTDGPAFDLTQVLQ
jgi:hypothetical protein